MDISRYLVRYTVNGYCDAMHLVNYNTNNNNNNGGTKKRTTTTTNKYDNNIIVK